jgi:chromosome segregation ATPase
MAEDEDYELLPHNEIRRLKDEISKLKGGSYAETDKGLRRAVSDLAEKISSMNEILESASQDLKEEDKEAEIIKDKIDPIMEKMTELVDQNEKIARGLVAINDIVDEKMTQLSGMLELFRAMSADIKDIKLDLKQLKMRKPEEPGMAPRPAFGMPPGPTVPPPPSAGPVRMESKARKGLFG